MGKMERKIKVYVAGPYSTGSQINNVRNVLEAADVLLDEGFIPFVPHLTHFWHFHSPKAYDTWLSYDFHWVLACDVLLRLPGECPGCEKETALAQEHQIPVFGTVTDLFAYFRGK